jgi:short-subunit dehydrogenase
MGVKLKPLDEQVIVITGASSGIGRVTARLAARKGASVVLVARNGRALKRAVRLIEDEGGRAIHVVADMAEEREVQHAAKVAVEEFGTIDTWVNNAGVGIYGLLEEISDEDHRRLFDVNYWGYVYGARAALPVLKAHGGALVNVGSVLSDRAIPLQGAYSASKHAVKAFTNALRMELEAEGAPVSVSLVKPATISTPYYKHARNYMDREPAMIPPVYSPLVVAKAILSCAVRPQRDVFAGGAGKAISATEKWTPRTTDKFMERTMFEGQQEDKPARGRDNLHRPLREDGAERNEDEGFVLERSAYTAASTNPGRAAAAIGFGVLAAAGLRMLLGRQRGAVDVTPREADAGDVDSVPDSAEAGLYAPGGTDR